MLKNTFFCNDCYYYWRIGGMVTPRDVKCFECGSRDVAKKHFPDGEYAHYADERVRIKQEKSQPKKTKIVDPQFVPLSDPEQVRQDAKRKWSARNA